MSVHPCVAPFPGLSPKPFIKRCVSIAQAAKEWFIQLMGELAQLDLHNVGQLDFGWLVESAEPVLERLNEIDTIREPTCSGLRMQLPVFGDEYVSRLAL